MKPVFRALALSSLFSFAGPASAVEILNASELKPVKLVTAEQVFGGWAHVARQHFAPDGILDQAMLKAAAH